MREPLGHLFDGFVDEYRQCLEVLISEPDLYDATAAMDRLRDSYMLMLHEVTNQTGWLDPLAPPIDDGDDGEEDSEAPALSDPERLQVTASLDVRISDPDGLRASLERRAPVDHFALPPSVGMMMVAAYRSLSEELVDEVREHASIGITITLGSDDADGFVYEEAVR